MAIVGIILGVCLFFGVVADFDTAFHKKERKQAEEQQHKEKQDSSKQENENQNPK